MMPHALSLAGCVGVATVGAAGWAVDGQSPEANNLTATRGLIEPDCLKLEGLRSKVIGVVERPRFEPARDGLPAHCNLFGKVQERIGVQGKAPDHLVARPAPPMLAAIPPITEVSDALAE